ncbi:MAG: response regulator transcription factor [Elusimicrobia bacterium]|nr:response regulator transcription factor [Elusimicrobiota bacterium]
MGDLKPRRTLIVEDDPGMRMFYATLFEQLREDGFTAVIAKDGERALDILRDEPVDLVLLDWNLPGISGGDLLRALRASPKTRTLGVLMVTGRRSLDDEIQALDFGADDYLVKPFVENELLGRLRSLGRRCEFDIARREAGRYPGLLYDPGAGQLRVGGKLVDLTSKERGLLGIFLHRPNVIHARAYLWETIWGYEYGNWESRLVFTLSSLRRKLGGAWGSLLKHTGSGWVLDITREPGQ